MPWPKQGQRGSPGSAISTKVWQLMCLRFQACQACEICETCKAGGALSLLLYLLSTLQLLCHEVLSENRRSDGLRSRLGSLLKTSAPYCSRTLTSTDQLGSLFFVTWHHSTSRYPSQRLLPNETAHPFTSCSLVSNFGKTPRPNDPVVRPP